jgi:Tol biopolymer transport system component
MAAISPGGAPIDGESRRGSTAVAEPMLAVALDHRPAHAREIQLVDLRGRRRRVNPHPPLPIDGAWSPDGSQMAFGGANTEDGMHGRSYGLYVMDARTHHVRLVYDAPRSDWVYSPSWSPDGRRLAFSMKGGGPWIVRVDGRGARRLANAAMTPGSPATWSPDGRVLAFGAYKSRVDAAVYTVYTHGKPRLRRLTRRHTRAEREASVAYPAWSPDGKRIAFERFGLASGSEISVVGADGRSERRLAHGAQAVFAPDGRRIAFVGIPFGIGLTDLTRSGARIVANAAGEEWKATWTTDGTRIVFVSGRSGMYVALPSGGERRLTASERRRLRVIGTPDQAWSRAGTLLAYEGDFTRRPFVLRMLTPRGVAYSARWSVDDAPAWGPRGRGLAFVRRTTIGTHQIYVLEVAKRRARRLVSGDRPVWSPDGGWIAFERRGSVFVIRASGGRALRVGAGEAAAWSPDGASLAMGGRGLFVARVGDWNLRRIDQPVGVHPGCGAPRPALLASSPAWSHDGRSIAFTFTAPWCDPPGAPRFAVVASEGAAQTEFEPVGRNPQWSRDDSVLYFRDHTDDLYSIRADGSDKKKLIDGPVGWYALSPDTRFVAYENRSDEVWFADLRGGSPRRLLRNAAQAHPVWRP